jgi:hypothetical protein
MRKRCLLRLVVPFLLWMLIAAGNALAATYYVDFASGADTNAGTSTTAPWKHAPGMTGCSGACNSTSLAGGDLVTFKGGVTWTASFPWTIAGGGAGATITYTTDHAWFSGSSFSQPTFDDQAAHPGGTGMLNATNVGHLTINDLKFVNCGASQVANSDKCLVFDGGPHDLSITNSTFACECWITIYLPITSTGTFSNFTVTGNDFSHTSGAIWMATEQANTQVTNVTYDSNTFHDFSSQIGGGTHGDGAWHWFTVPQGDSTQFLETMQFCNNKFYGDFHQSFGGSGGMTAFFYTEGGAKNLTLCNNDMSFTSAIPGNFDGLIVLSGSNTSAGTAAIYNNSLANIGANAMSGGINVRGSFVNVTVRNNIASGMQYCVDVEDTGSQTGFVSDYNLFNCSSGSVGHWGTPIQTYAQWRALGHDTHSSFGVDPGWVAAPGNERLSASSPALNLGAGTNLTGLAIPVLDSDLTGVARPASGAWALGAYQGGAAATTPSVAPPTNLSVSVN